MHLSWDSLRANHGDRHYTPRWDLFRRLLRDEAIHAFDTLLLFTLGSVLWQVPRTDTERERLVRVTDPADI